ncbi:MAG: hypothetical protein J6X72_04135 [Clostridia bacterium]|nr:hypothetical protein [Clostridia bacterium]
MKKVLSILLVFALLFPLVSCVTKKEKEKAKNKVTVYGDGVIPNIIASTRIPSTAVDDILKIRGTLRTRLGSNPGYGSDTTEKSGVEIVFGDTSRAVTARAKEFLPTRDGDEATYVIYFDEDGAAVVWNHDYAAIVGVKYFADNYLGEATLKIASGTKYVGTLSVSAYADELRMQE